MAKRPITAAVLLITLCISVGAQELSLSELARLVVDNDPNIEIASRSLSSTENAYELLKASVRPQVTASQAPSYSYSSGKSLLPPYVDADVHNISLGIGVTQALPTDGALVANLTSSTTITTTGDEVEISQSPSLSITLSQPLFINGKIIDFDIFQARKDTQGRIPIGKAASREVSARNGAITAAFSAYTAIVELRSRLGFLERNIDIAERKLELTNIRAKQGGVTLKDVWEAEIAVETLREQRLELKYNLLETEQLLGRAVGESVRISETVLLSEIPTIEYDLSKDSVAEHALFASTEVLENTLSLEESDRNAIIGGRQYASDLSISFSLEPNYAPGSDRNDQLEDSFGDLFDENAYLSPSLSIGLSVPVYQGGQQRYQEKINEDARYIAQATLISSRQRIMDTVNNLFLRRDMLGEKSNLVSESYALELERLSDSKRLFELKSLTSIELDESELKADEKKLEVWRTRADLFLNALDILSTAGHDIQMIIEG